MTFIKMPFYKVPDYLRVRKLTIADAERFTYIPAKRLEYWAGKIKKLTYEENGQVYLNKYLFDKLYRRGLFFDRKGFRF